MHKLDYCQDTQYSPLCLVEDRLLRDFFRAHGKPGQDCESARKSFIPAA
jgi:hypothetical protein